MRSCKFTLPAAHCAQDELIVGDSSPACTGCSDTIHVQPSAWAAWLNAGILFQMLAAAQIRSSRHIRFLISHLDADGYVSFTYTLTIVPSWADIYEYFGEYSCVSSCPDSPFYLASCNSHSFTLSLCLWTYRHIYQRSARYSVAGICRSGDFAQTVSPRTPANMSTPLGAPRLL